MDRTTLPLIINGSNLVSSTYNNVYKYQPPVGQFTFPKGSRIGIGSIAMYYSWFNFSDAYGNNTFSINFSGFGTLDIDIGNQSLSITNLNSYVQQQLITNNLYLINSDGQYVYYFEIVENAATYQVQVNLFPVPSALPSGWTDPGGLTLDGYCPSFTIPDTAFQQIIGFSAGTYGNLTTTTTQSFVSSFTPQVSPVQSVQVGCSLLRNYMNQNPTILYTFSSTGVDFGGLISTAPTYPMFSPIYPGNYSAIEVAFYDQNGSPLAINDTNVVIQLQLQIPDT